MLLLLLLLLLLVVLLFHPHPALWSTLSTLTLHCGVQGALWLLDSDWGSELWWQSCVQCAAEAVCAVCCSGSVYSVLPLLCVWWLVSGVCSAAVAETAVCAGRLIVLVLPALVLC